MILIISMLTKELDEHSLEWVIKDDKGHAHLKIRPTIQGFFSWGEGSGQMTLYDPYHYLFLVFSDYLYRSMFTQKETT